MSSLREDEVTVVLTGKLSTSSSPITIISYDLATKLATELAHRKPDAIIVVSQNDSNSSDLHVFVKTHSLHMYVHMYMYLYICSMYMYNV